MRWLVQHAARPSHAYRSVTNVYRKVRSKTTKQKPSKEAAHVRPRRRGNNGGNGRRRLWTAKEKKQREARRGEAWGKGAPCLACQAPQPRPWTHRMDRTTVEGPCGAAAGLVGPAATEHERPPASVGDLHMIRPWCRKAAAGPGHRDAPNPRPAHDTRAQSHIHTAPKLIHGPLPPTPTPTGTQAGLAPGPSDRRTTHDDDGGRDLVARSDVRPTAGTGCTERGREYEGLLP